jgi:hypothetical protein
MPGDVKRRCTRRCEGLSGAFAPSALVADIQVCHYCGETRRAPTAPEPATADQRPAAAPTLFTIGYVGMRLEPFLQVMQQRRIELVLDTRWSAWSRNDGFCQAPLRRALVSRRIAYRHRPELGTSPDLRHHLDADGDWAAFVAAYAATLTTHAALLRSVAAYARTHRVCLLCAEHEPAHCHRSVLAQRLADLAGLTIEHLKAW